MPDDEVIVPDDQPDPEYVDTILEGSGPDDDGPEPAQAGRILSDE